MANDTLGLGGDTYGMLDAQGLIANANDLRYRCDDETRDLHADAIWTPTPADWTELLTSLIYSATSRSVDISTSTRASSADQMSPQHGAAHCR